jgi:hypothetical protein
MSEHTLPAPGEPIAPYLQFGLRHLFGLTTLAAIATAVALHSGPGTLLTSGGLIVAWLNWCGAFHAVQSGRRQVLLLWLAWGLFLLSLALPSVKIFGDVYGWGAAWMALVLPLEAIRKGNLAPALLWYAVMDIANIVALGIPLLIWRLNRGRGQFASGLLAAAMVGPWIVAGPEMLTGYYVWSASFLIVLVALPVRCETLIAMIVIAALIGIAADWTLLQEAWHKLWPHFLQPVVDPASLRAATGQIASTLSPRQA